MIDITDEEKRRVDAEERAKLDPYSRALRDCLKVVKFQFEQEEKTHANRSMQDQTVIGNVLTTVELELKKNIKKLFGNAENESK